MYTHSHAHTIETIKEKKKKKRESSFDDLTNSLCKLVLDWISHVYILSLDSEVRRQIQNQLCLKFSFNPSSTTKAHLLCLEHRICVNVEKKAKFDKNGPLHWSQMICAATRI